MCGYKHILNIFIISSLWLKNISGLNRRSGTHFGSHMVKLQSNLYQIIFVPSICFILKLPIQKHSKQWMIYSLLKCMLHRHAFQWYQHCGKLLIWVCFLFFWYFTRFSRLLGSGWLKLHFNVFITLIRRPFNAIAKKYQAT